MAQFPPGSWWPVSVPAVAYPSRSAWGMSLFKPWMEPANPPFPTPMNFPFQFWVGSQSSILIRESDVGLRTI